MAKISYGPDAVTCVKPVEMCRQFLLPSTGRQNRLLSLLTPQISRPPPSIIFSPPGSSRRHRMVSCTDRHRCFGWFPTRIRCRKARRESVSREFLSRLCCRQHVEPRCPGYHSRPKQTHRRRPAASTLRQLISKHRCTGVGRGRFCSPCLDPRCS